MKLLVLDGAGLCFGDVRLGQVKDRGGRALEEHVVVDRGEQLCPRRSGSPGPERLMLSYSRYLPQKCFGFSCSAARVRHATRPGHITPKTNSIHFMI